MIIEFKIPNGEIRIRPNEFFIRAGKHQVNRMFQMLLASNPSPACLDEVESYLRENTKLPYKDQAETFAAYLKIFQKMRGGKRKTRTGGEAEQCTTTKS